MLRKVPFSLLLLLSLSYTHADKMPKGMSSPYKPDSILEDLMDKDSALAERFAKHNRMKRDILLMDDDLDMSSELERWNDSRPDKPPTNSRPDKLPTNSYTTKPVTTSTVQNRTLEVNFVNEKSVRSRTARMVSTTSEISTSQQKPAMADVPDENGSLSRIDFEGSGDEIVADVEETSVNVLVVNVTPSVVQSSTTEDIETLDAEGSGKDNLVDESLTTTEYTSHGLTNLTELPNIIDESSTVNEFSTHGSSTAQTTTEYMPTDSEIVQEHCLNKTCEVDDLIITPDLKTIVPVGVNLSLTCISAQAESILQWYNLYVSDNSSIEVMNKSNQTRLHILETKSHHSGSYVCILSREQTCCHRQVEIVVYEVPDYKLHLGIIGFVAGFSFVICMIFGYCKKYHVKKLEKELELQGVEKPFLI